MSIDKARLWLREHGAVLPVFKANLPHVDDDNVDQPETRLIDQVSADPALALALLSKVNASRSETSGKDIVTSAQSAIALLGERVCQALIGALPVAEQQLTQPDAFFLYSQICNRSLHLRFQIVAWAKQSGYHQLEELDMPALLYYCGEALCCCLDYSRYQKYVMAGSTPGSESEWFGFSYPQLTDAVCQQMNLPVLIHQALQLDNSARQQAHLMYHAATLCRLCEQGWYDSVMNQAFDQFAETLHMPVERVIHQFHLNSVESARQSPLVQAWQPASRLLLIRDSVWRPAHKTTRPAAPAAQKPVSPKPEAPVKVAATPPTQTADDKMADRLDAAIAAIKQILKAPDATQSSILQACITGLARQLEFQRVGLFLLSRDKTTLQIRMSAGIPKDSPLRQMQLKLDQSGLFKLLLKKPQAIWINPGNFDKYAALLPARFLMLGQSQNFAAMSLFIADKPVAIVMVDQHGAKTPLQADDFAQFKKMVSFCSKALAYLHKHPN